MDDYYNQRRPDDRRSNSYMSAGRLSRTNPGESDDDMTANDRYHPGSNKQTSPDSSDSGGGAYRVIRPNETKRQQILEKAARETRAYEEHKAKRNTSYYNETGTLGGGFVSEDVARRQQSVQHKTAPLRLREKREEQQRKRKEEEQREYDKKKAAQREKAVANERREHERAQNLAQQERQERKKFLDNLELSRSHVTNKPITVLNGSQPRQKVNQSKSTTGQGSSPNEVSYSSGDSPSTAQSSMMPNAPRSRGCEETSKKPSAFIPVVSKHSTSNASQLNAEKSKSSNMPPTHFGGQPSTANWKKEDSDSETPISHDAWKKIQQERDRKKKEEAEKEEAFKKQQREKAEKLEKMQEETVRRDHQQKNAAWLAKLEQDMKRKSENNEQSEHDGKDESKATTVQKSEATTNKTQRNPEVRHEQDVQSPSKSFDKDLIHKHGEADSDDEIEQIFRNSPATSANSQYGTSTSKVASEKWNSVKVKEQLPASNSAQYATSSSNRWKERGSHSSSDSTDSDTQYAAFKKRQMEAVYWKVHTGVEPGVRKKDDFFHQPSKGNSAAEKPQISSKTSETSPEMFYNPKPLPYQTKKSRVVDSSDDDNDSYESKFKNLQLSDKPNAKQTVAARSWKKQSDITSSSSLPYQSDHRPTLQNNYPKRTDFYESALHAYYHFDSDSEPLPDSKTKDNDFDKTAGRVALKADKLHYPERNWSPKDDLQPFWEGERTAIGAEWTGGSAEGNDDESALLNLLKMFPEYDCDALMELLEQLGDTQSVINMLTS